MTDSVAQNASLERFIEVLESQNPGLFALYQADTEEKFISATEAGLEKVIVTIENNAKHYVKLDERGLSILFVMKNVRLALQAVGGSESTSRLAAPGGGWVRVDISTRGIRRWVGPSRHLDLRHPGVGGSESRCWRSVSGGLGCESKKWAGF